MENRPWRTIGLVALAFGLFAHPGVTAPARKGFDLVDGRTIVGQVVDEGSTGYLVETGAGDKVWIAHTDIKTVWVVPGGPRPAAPRETPSAPVSTPVPPTPAPAPVVPQKPVAERVGLISAGLRHTCAITSAGSARCWGWDGNRQTRPQDGPMVQVTSGGEHTCGLLPSGRIHCWGANGNGQLNAPKGLFVQVSAGMRHTCALDAQDRIHCWGANSVDQVTVPTGKYVQIDAGYDFSCALTDSSTIRC